jgi:hypothetical protein
MPGTFRLVGGTTAADAQPAASLAFTGDKHCGFARFWRETLCAETIEGMTLIDKQGHSAICAGACGKTRRNYLPKAGRWFCPDCRERILRHAIGRLRRVQGFPPRNSITVPFELERALAKRWYAELGQTMQRTRQQTAV